MIQKVSIQRRKVSFHSRVDSLVMDDILLQKTHVAHSYGVKMSCCFRFKQKNWYILIA